MQTSIRDVRVIVVGAGLAGLSAARQLIKSGFDNTIVLEASERFGGRINSILFGHVYCELGAKWISIDGSENSVYELISQTSQLKPKILKTNEKYTISESYKIKKFQKQINLNFKNICCEIDKKYCKGDIQHLGNILTYLKTETDKILRSMSAHSERKLASDIFSTRLRECGRFFGGCLKNICIEHMVNWNGREIRQIYLPAGMDSILYNLTNGFNNDHIKIAHPVCAINWFDSIDPQKKSVSCLDGSQFIADHVICTLPLGVLKNFSKYLFFPNLPEKKFNTIKNLGFACPIIIFIEYKKCITSWFVNTCPPWKPDEYNRLNWTKQIIDIAKISESQKVIEIAIGGPFTEEIEKLPDTEILLDVTMFLRRFMKNPSIPYPVSLLRSNWSTNACFLGGRPFISTSSTTDDVEELGTPLGEPLSLLFAGDATIANGFGTIDGARKSGLREAQRIINYYNRTS